MMAPIAALCVFLLAVGAQAVPDPWTQMWKHKEPTTNNLRSRGRLDFARHSPREIDATAAYLMGAQLDAWRQDRGKHGQRLTWLRGSLGGIQDTRKTGFGLDSGTHHPLLDLFYPIAPSACARSHGGQIVRVGTSDAKFMCATPALLWNGTAATEGDDDAMDDEPASSSSCPPERTTVVFSLGSANSFSFERDLAALCPCCRIYIFDCLPTYIGKANRQFNEKKFHRYIKPRDRHRVTFERTCIGRRPDTASSSENWKTFAEAARDLGHRRVDLLKMDIEGSEYDVLDHLLGEQDDGGMPSIWQIMVELHVFKTTRDAPRVVALAQALQRRGFVTMGREDNWYHARCAEFVFLRADKK